jgi:hypothetical protein
MRALPKLFSLIFLVTIVAVPILAADAKPTISLSLYKDNGYGLGDDVGGQWTLKTATSDDVVYVEFYLDDQLQLNDTSSPYSWQFNTNNYTLGEHTFIALAYDAQGESTAATIDRKFVEYDSSSTFLLIIAISIAVVAIAVGISVYRIKKTKK